MTFNVGDVVSIPFDERGLARIVGVEDGMYEIVYLPDPGRRSQHVHAGETASVFALDAQAA